MGTSGVKRSHAEEPGEAGRGRRGSSRRCRAGPREGQRERERESSKGGGSGPRPFGPRLVGSCRRVRVIARPSQAIILRGRDVAAAATAAAGAAVESRRSKGLLLEARKGKGRSGGGVEAGRAPRTQSLRVDAPRPRRRPRREVCRRGSAVEAAPRSGPGPHVGAARPPPAPSPVGPRRGRPAPPRPPDRGPATTPYGGGGPAQARGADHGHSPPTGPRPERGVGGAVPIGPTRRGPPPARQATPAPGQGATLERESAEGPGRRRRGEGRVSAGPPWYVRVVDGMLKKSLLLRGFTAPDDHGRDFFHSSCALGRRAGVGGSRPRPLPDPSAPRASRQKEGPERRRGFPAACASPGGVCRPRATTVGGPHTLTASLGPPQIGLLGWGLSTYETGN